MPCLSSARAAALEEKHVAPDSCMNNKYLVHKEYRRTPHCTTQQALWSLILKGAGWQPPSYRPEQTQARRKEANEKASQKRRANTRHRQVGDRLIVKDLKPAFEIPHAL
ncbi:hypothetical protein NDU88_002698 [Pleurodeles waltl]|uniref:Uncharacterized protein n=1 Tax=Pleurodeles waltl TaxID=8319 RepID=A0AAV7T2R1_PLEWA|nr:hypothetical protein NDU88_002698 [Pleurodeles waltl]